MTDDAIEREIFINASIDHVWSLVSKAGFWIGDELHFEFDAQVGETVVIDVKDYGRIPLRVERLEPPHRAVYRTSGSPDDDPTGSNSTLVEFALEERDGGVMVRLTESGFGNLPGTPESRDAQREENVEGWAMQLERLRSVSEATQG